MLRYSKKYEANPNDRALFDLTMRIAALVFGGRLMQEPTSLGFLTCQGLFLAATLTLQPRYLCTPWGGLFPDKEIVEPLDPAIGQRLIFGEREDWSGGTTIELLGIDKDRLPDSILFTMDTVEPDNDVILAAWKALVGT